MGIQQEKIFRENRKYSMRRKLTVVQTYMQTNTYTHKMKVNIGARRGGRVMVHIFSPALRTWRQVNLCVFHRAT